MLAIVTKGSDYWGWSNKYCKIAKWQMGAAVIVVVVVVGIGRIAKYLFLHDTSNKSQTLFQISYSTEESEKVMSWFACNTNSVCVTDTWMTPSSDEETTIPSEKWTLNNYSDMTTRLTVSTATGIHDGLSCPSCHHSSPRYHSKRWTNGGGKSSRWITVLP